MPITTAPAVPDGAPEPGQATAPAGRRTPDGPRRARDLGRWATGLRAALRYASPALAGYVLVRLAGLALLANWADGEGRELWPLLATGWDSQWYLEIADRGYDRAVTLDGRHSNLAFFPLYPASVRAVDWLLPGSPATAGLWVAVAASLAAAWGIFAVGDLLYGRRAGAALAVLWGATPVALVQWMGYTESLFTALAAWSLHAVLTGHWVRAGALAALAGLTRPTGVAVGAAVSVAAATTLWRLWRARRPERTTDATPPRTAPMDRGDLAAPADQEERAVVADRGDPAARAASVTAATTPWRLWRARRPERTTGATPPRTARNARSRRRALATPTSPAGTAGREGGSRVEPPCAGPGPAAPTGPQDRAVRVGAAPGRANPRAVLAGGVLAPLGWLGFYAWVGLRVGRWDGYLAVQRDWRNEWDGGAATWEALWHNLTQLTRPQLFLLVVSVTLLASTGLYLLSLADRQPLPLLVFSGVLLLIVLGSAGVYFPRARFLMPAFPLLLPVALSVSRARPQAAVLVLLAATLSSAYLGGYMSLVYTGPP